MRRALVVGIDDYPSAPLHGCVNDAKQLAHVLEYHDTGRRNFQCVLVTTPPSPTTRAILREKLRALFCQPADLAFFHFSGHGTVMNLDGYLVTPDYDQNDPGISMSEVLSLANNSQVKEIFITLDCCYSGRLGGVPAINSDTATLREGVSIITATRSGQEALEVGSGGVFSNLLVESLAGGAADLLGKVSAASVYSYIDNALGAWDQRPLFKAHVSRFAELREAKPKIELATLRKIVQHFPLPAEELLLSPEFEPEAEPHNTKREDTFRDLLKLRDAGLVIPVGEDHMYYAAIHSKSCALTSLGKYYWRLVNEKKI